MRVGGLAAAAILIVLVTPALDELPCTIGKHTRNRRVPISATTILPLTLPSPPAGYHTIPAAVRS
jgi:hypothetical protein